MSDSINALVNNGSAARSIVCPQCQAILRNPRPQRDGRYRCLQCDHTFLEQATNELTNQSTLESASTAVPLETEPFSSVSYPVLRIFGLIGAGALLLAFVLSCIGTFYMLSYIDFEVVGVFSALHLVAIPILALACWKGTALICSAERQIEHRVRIAGYRLDAIERAPYSGLSILLPTFGLGTLTMGVFLLQYDHQLLIPGFGCLALGIVLAYMCSDLRLFLWRLEQLGSQLREQFNPETMRYQMRHSTEYLTMVMLICAIASLGIGALAEMQNMRRHHYRDHSSTLIFLLLFFFAIVSVHWLFWIFTGNLSRACQRWLELLPLHLRGNAKSWQQDTGMKLYRLSCFAHVPISILWFLSLIGSHRIDDGFNWFLVVFLLGAFQAVLPAFLYQCINLIRYMQHLQQQGLNALSDKHPQRDHTLESNMEAHAGNLEIVLSIFILCGILGTLGLWACFLSINGMDRFSDFMSLGLLISGLWSIWLFLYYLTRTILRWEQSQREIGDA